MTNNLQRELHVIKTIAETPVAGIRKLLAHIILSQQKQHEQVFAERLRDLRI